MAVSKDVIRAILRDTHEALQGLSRNKFEGAGSTEKMSVKLSRRSNSYGLNFKEQIEAKQFKAVSEFSVTSNRN